MKIAKFKLPFWSSNYFLWIIIVYNLRSIIFKEYLVLKFWKLYALCKELDKKKEDKGMSENNCLPTYVFITVR